VSARPRLYGVIAEFTSPTDLVRAIEEARSAGYQRMDAYTPYPVEEVSEALGHHWSPLPLIVLIGGLLGGTAGFALQYWTSAIDYPLNVGGRPYNSLIAFIPVIFECTILVAALFAVLGMLALNGLPMPHHPIFNAPRFALASSDRFFLCIEATDPRFDAEEARRFLERLAPRAVSEVDA
jgi:hypothetical protein